jgi:hypothetical protein
MSASKLTIPQHQIDTFKDIRQKRIEELRKRAENINLVPLPRGKSYKAIAISVDASNVPVETDVVDAVVIRCSDSNGGLPYYQGLVPTDGPVSAIEDFLDSLFGTVPVLLNLLNRMKASSWRKIADFGVAQARTDIDRFVMEMLEWGTLVTLAEKSSQTILLKDGLLRSKAFKPQGGYLDNLRMFFEQNADEKGNFFIGIAKESAVLEKYKVLLKFVKGFSENRAFYLKIPQDLLQDTYGWRYLDADIVWGDLYFVRTQAHSQGRVMTVEIPSFLEKRLDEILRILADFRLRSLPDRFRGLPDPVASAHENTTLIKSFGKSIQKEIMQ